MTTTGYGDIVPAAALTRSLANLEAVIGQLFPATLLARLVGLHLVHEQRDRRRD
ncbi:ion channel [Escherichia coli]|uniref:ion channel n=1 Tax=Escherichia coli TaxID=562 RepID=UPI003908886C